MKILFFEKAHQPFLFTGLIALCIAIFFKGVYPGAFFDINIYHTDIDIAKSRIWFWFSSYLFFLAFTYFIINIKGFRTKKWLVVSHYVFIVLFLIFFIAFSSFSNPGIQKLTVNFSLSSLLMLYATIFFIDILLFILGLVLLIANLISAHKSASK